MRSLILVATALSAAMFSQTAPQDSKDYDVKRCTPRVAKQAPIPDKVSIHIHKGEKPSRFSPIIAFHIEESGEVTHARVKRSSGIADLDNYALNSIRGDRYSKRPGCGVIESEADVIVDYR